VKWVNDEFKTKECKECGIFYASNKCPYCERVKMLNKEKKLVIKK